MLQGRWPSFQFPTPWHYQRSQAMTDRVDQAWPVVQSVLCRFMALASRLAGLETQKYRGILVWHAYPFGFRRPISHATVVWVCGMCWVGSKQSGTEILLSLRSWESSTVHSRFIKVQKCRKHQYQASRPLHNYKDFTCYTLGSIHESYKWYNNFDIGLCFMQSSTTPSGHYNFLQGRTKNFSP